jgi:hypothetical protein
MLLQTDIKDQAQPKKKRKSEQLIARVALNMLTVVFHLALLAGTTAKSILKSVVMPQHIVLVIMLAPCFGITGKARHTGNKGTRSKSANQISQTGYRINYYKEPKLLC